MPSTRILLPIADTAVVNPHSSYTAPAYPKVRVLDGVNTSSTVVLLDGDGSVECAIEKMVAAETINLVTVTGRFTNLGGGIGIGDGRAWLRIGATKFYSTSGPMGGAADFSKGFPLHPVLLKPWTTVSVNEIAAIGMECFNQLAAPAAGCDYLAAVVDYAAPAPGFDAARDVGSRRLWVRRVGDRWVITGPVRLLDFKPGDRIEWEELLDASGRRQGLVSGVWQYKPLWVESVVWDPERYAVTLTCKDHRDKLLRFYNSGYAKSAGVQGDGLMLVSPGAASSYTRASPAEGLDATGQLVSVSEDVPMYAARGEVAQGARTNFLLNSAFALGVDVSWTSSGEGSNGSNISPDTTTGLWSLDLAPQCAKIQGGSPAHVADLQHTAAAVTGRTGFHSVSAFHKDVLGPMSMAVQRSIDSKWYRNSDQTWQAAKTWNALPQRAGFDRDSIRGMDVGISSTSLSVLIGIPTSGAIAGQVSYVAHVQIEAGKYPASPIRTLAATVTRAADVSAVANNSGARTLSAAQFTVMVEAETFWSAAELTAGDLRTAWIAYHNAANYILLQYKQSTASWTATLRVAGVNYTAAAAHSPVAGTRYVITVRFVGSRGELGKAPYTLAVLVDGVEGATTAVASGPIVEVDPATIQWGHNAGADPLFGYIRQRFSSPQVLSDVEISRGI